MVVGDEAGGTHTIVRRVKTVRGEVRFRMTLDPRFDYGRAGRTVSVKEGEVLFVSTGPDKTALRLRTRDTVNRLAAEETLGPEVSIARRESCSERGAHGCTRRIGQ